MADKVGLVMTGGGARAAYQVGVLQAIATIVPKCAPSPFTVISGTSAGAINAAALGGMAGNYRKAVYRLLTVWANFHANQVFRTDVWGITKTGVHWLAATMLAGFGKNISSRLLDRSPLRALLTEKLSLGDIQQSIDKGILHAISIGATGYTSGQCVAFFQGHESLQPWRRFSRVGCREDISIDHLLASSAIPIIFEAIRLNREYFGDGSMRLSAPISASLHLGADRVLVIGNSLEGGEEDSQADTISTPSFAQISGHVLNSIFLDSLEADLERLKRINKTISLIPSHRLEEGGVTLRPVETLLISPSQDLGEMARPYVSHLPRSIRILLMGIGALKKEGSSLISYLLFEKAYCRSLIKLGYNDAMLQLGEIKNLLEIK